MKKLLMIIACIALLPAIAKANCYQIRNDDAQKMCLAEIKNDSGYCWQIKDSDLQKECLAKIKKDRNYCWQIKNEDKKQACLARY